MVNEAYESVEEGITTDTAITTERESPEDKRVEASTEAEKEVEKDMEGIEGIMSSEDETVGIREELQDSVSFNPEPLFEDDKVRDITENKFNFDD